MSKKVIFFLTVRMTFWRFFPHEICNNDIEIYFLLPRYFYCIILFPDHIHHQETCLFSGGKNARERAQDHFTPTEALRRRDA